MLLKIVLLYKLNDLAHRFAGNLFSLITFVFGIIVFEKSLNFTVLFLLLHTDINQIEILMGGGDDMTFQGLKINANDKC